MESAKHTPTPWESPLHPILNKDGEGYNFSNGDYEIYPPLGESGPVSIVNSKKNAAFIVTAVNAHDDSIKALKAAEAHLTALCVMLREGDLTRWNSSATVTTIQEIRSFLKEIGE